MHRAIITTPGVSFVVTGGAQFELSPNPLPGPMSVRKYNRPPRLPSLFFPSSLRPSSLDTVYVRQSFLACSLSSVFPPSDSSPFLLGSSYLLHLPFFGPHVPDFVAFPAVRDVSYPCRFMFALAPISRPHPSSERYQGTASSSVRLLYYFRPVLVPPESFTPIDPRTVSCGRGIW